MQLLTVQHLQSLLQHILLQEVCCQSSTLWDKCFNPAKPNYIFSLLDISLLMQIKFWEANGMNIYNILTQNSLWPVCVWAHFSWHSLGSHTPLQSLLFCHHQTESWSQRRTQRQGWSCTFWQVSPWFQSWGLWPCRDAEHRQPTEKTDVVRRRLITARTILWTEEPYHLLPLKQAIRHELAGPDCHCVILKMLK